MPTEISTADFERHIQELAAYCGDAVTVTDWANARHLHCAAYRVLLSDRALLECETWRQATNKRDWARLAVQHRLGLISDAEAEQLAAQMVGLPAKPGAQDDVLITHSLSEQFNQALDVKVQAVLQEDSEPISVTLTRGQWAAVFRSAAGTYDALRDDLGSTSIHEHTVDFRNELDHLELFIAEVERLIPSIGDPTDE